MIRARVRLETGSFRLRRPFAAAAFLAFAAQGFAQSPPEGISSGIPYLAPMVTEDSPILMTESIPSGFGAMPAPGYRPIMPLTDVSGHAGKSGCICTVKSTWRRLFRKKCAVHPDIPPTFVPNPYQEPPLGSQVYQIMNTQVRNNDAARQVLNHYDFIDDSSELNYAGKRKLMRIAQGSRTNFAPIVVESTPRHPGLDQSRRTKLVQEIASLGLPIPAERVIVGRSYQQGLRGSEAALLYQGSLAPLTQGAQGGLSGFGMGSASGMSGAGMLPSVGGGGASGGF
jgi:hypothetical protein